MLKETINTIDASYIVIFTSINLCQATKELIK